MDLGDKREGRKMGIIGDIAISYVSEKVVRKTDELRVANTIDNLHEELLCLSMQVRDEVKKEYLANYFAYYCKEKLGYIGIEFSESNKVLLTNDEKRILDEGKELVDKTIHDLLSLEGNILNKKIDYISNRIDQFFGSQTTIDNIPIIEKKEECITNDIKIYYDAWNEKLFLHRNMDPGIKLCDLFVFPRYSYIHDYKDYNDLENVIERALIQTHKILIIQGYPGIGKSSLVTYIVTHFLAKDNYICIRFGTVGQKNVKNADTFWKCLKKNFTINKKVVILDGFDENIYINDKTKFTIELINLAKEDNCILFIFTRANYIEFNNKEYEEYFRIADIITLKNFKSDKIEQFQRKYASLIESHVDVQSLYNDEEIFGIPIILYMIFAMDVDIKNISSRYELYDCIFSPASGIYEKCYIKGERYGKVIRKLSVDEKNVLDIIAHSIAYKMYISNESIPRISRADVDDIISAAVEKYDSLEKDKIKEIYLISNYYNVGEYIEFIHRSIYEYFAGTFLAKKFWNALDKEDYKELHTSLFYFFNSPNFSVEISEIVIYRLCYYYDMKGKTLLEKFLDFLENIGINGITSLGQNFHIKEELFCLRNLIVFADILITESEFSRLFFSKCVDKEELEIRIKYILKKNIRHLRNMDFSGINFCGDNFEHVDLRGSDLTNCKLENTHFEDADLRKVKVNVLELKKAYLNGMKCDKELFDMLKNNRKVY